MSSKRRYRARACSEKKHYTDRDHARADAKAVEARTGKTTEAYRCRFSGDDKPHYHVGHVRRRTRRRPTGEVA